jgi:hypothetical protein
MGVGMSVGIGVGVSVGVDVGVDVTLVLVVVQVMAELPAIANAPVFRRLATVVCQTNDEVQAASGDDQVCTGIVKVAIVTVAEAAPGLLESG